MSEEVDVFRRHLNVLIAITAFGVAVFLGLFTWYGLGHLVVTSACYGLGSFACLAVHRIFGRAALSREIYLFASTPI